MNLTLTLRCGRCDAPATTSCRACGDLLCAVHTCCTVQAPTWLTQEITARVCQEPWWRYWLLRLLGRRPHGAVCKEGKDTGTMVRTDLRPRHIQEILDVLRTQERAALARYEDAPAGFERGYDRGAATAYQAAIRVIEVLTMTKGN